MREVLAGMVQQEVVPPQEPQSWKAVVQSLIENLFNNQSPWVIVAVVALLMAAVITVGLVYIKSRRGRWS